MSESAILLFFLGLALVIGGAETVVRGASRLASTLGVPALIIGLTVVAFGTSAPELVVNLQAATTGRGDIAFGNVIGSNIFNVLFVLGVSAIIAPLRVSEQLIRLDLPVMIGSASLLMLLAMNGRIGRVDGLVLLGILFTYLGLLLTLARRRPELVPVHAEIVVPAGQSRWYVDVLFMVTGIAGLVLGSRWFVQGAVEFSRMLGLSELVIGLTIVAGGTSLPEVATSVAASLRGQRDLAVGNVVGSNIFNVLLVVGSTATLVPGGVPVAPAALHLDLPMMVTVSIASLPIFFAGMRITRLEGGIFLA
ncbi:MAG: calcium/sodium antiporter, partial [Gemmatimonadota bacterium]